MRESLVGSLYGKCALLVERLARGVVERVNVARRVCVCLESDIVRLDVLATRHVDATERFCLVRACPLDRRRLAKVAVAATRHARVGVGPWLAGVAPVDGRCKLAQADKAPARDRRRNANSRNREHDVHHWVQIDEEHDSRDRVDEEGDKEIEDTIVEQELPQLRAAGSDEQPDKSQDEDDQVREHGPEVDQVEEQPVDLCDDTSIGRWIIESLDGRDSVEEDTPLSGADETERNDDCPFLVPDRNRPEHEQCRCGTNRRVSTILIPGVEDLAIDNGTRDIEGDEHPQESTEQDPFAVEVQYLTDPELSAAADNVELKLAREEDL